MSFLLNSKINIPPSHRQSRKTKPILVNPRASGNKDYMLPIGRLTLKRWEDGVNREAFPNAPNREFVPSFIF